MSHTGANLTSGAIVGTSATALTTIGLAAWGSTRNIRCIFNSRWYSFGCDKFNRIFYRSRPRPQEKESRRRSRKSKNTIKSTSLARQKLLETLPNYGYDFDKALNAFNDKGKSWN
jgi:hypothetical protein